MALLSVAMYGPRGLGVVNHHIRRALKRMGKRGTSMSGEIKKTYPHFFADKSHHFIQGQTFVLLLALVTGFPVDYSLIVVLF